MLTAENKNLKLFYYWILLSFFLIFIMVVVGGLTRLTDSGLSITEWELVKGILPPLTNEDWNYYFSLYKEIPQYKLLYNGMSLKEFKIIFYWEYFHRILGRIIGLFFLLPFLYFYFTKKLHDKYFIPCLIILFLIITQGIIGWYMVSSGLVNNVSVSHYRLSVHLFIAFVIISIIFWILLDVKNQSNFNKIIIRKEYDYLFYLFILLIFLQVILGAFVSGLDAGKVYQTWPLMNYNYFPNETDNGTFKELFNFENHGLVQFYHRNIAYFITLYSSFIGYFILKKKIKHLNKPFFYVLLFLLIQIILGVVTLISDVNIFLASGHQIFSLLLTLSVINLYYRYIN